MKIIILIFIITTLYPQNNPKVEDDRAEWLLTNKSNVNKISKEKSKILKTEFENILSDFNKELQASGLLLPYDTTIHYSTGGKHMNQGEYKYLRNQGIDPATSKLMSMRNTTIAKKNKGYRGFLIGKTLSKKVPEWSEIVEYYGGYSGLRKSGIKKEDLKSFEIERILKKIEITGDSKCVALIDIKGKKEYGLKFYNIDETEKLIEGNYKVEAISIEHIYMMGAKNSKRYPTITFSFTDKELIDSKNHKFTKTLPELNNKILSISSPYYESIAMMIDDIVPMDYYKNLAHIKSKINAQNNKLRQAQKNKEKVKKEGIENCNNALNDLKNKYLESLELHMALKISDVDSKTMKRIKKRLKKYEKRHKKGGILRNVRINGGALTIESDGNFEEIPRTNIDVNIYTKEFLEICYKEKIFKIADALELLVLEINHEKLKNCNSFLALWRFTTIEQFESPNQAVKAWRSMKARRVDEINLGSFIQTSVTAVSLTELQKNRFSVWSLLEMINAIPYYHVRNVFEKYGYISNRSISEKGTTINGAYFAPPNYDEIIESMHIDLEQNFKECLRHIHFKINGGLNKTKHQSKIKSHHH